MDWGEGGVKQGEQYIPYSFLLLIFSLCFSIPFLRDHGKSKVVLQNGAVKMEGEVPVQPYFFQVKHFFS